MNTPASWTRPPLVGRLHEMAVTRPVPAPEVWWGHRKVAEAMRTWPAVVIDPHEGYEVLLDELAGCERLDLSGSECVIGPFKITGGRGAAWSPFDHGIAGEW